MINHELIKQCQHKIDRFHDSACRHHGEPFLELSITSGYIQPIGEYLEVKTSKGDRWYIESDKATPDIYYSPAGDYVTKEVHFTVEDRSIESYKTKVLSHSDGSFTLGNTKFLDEVQLYNEIERLVEEEDYHYAPNVYVTGLVSEDASKVIGFEIN